MNFGKMKNVNQWRRERIVYFVLMCDFVESEIMEMMIKYEENFMKFLILFYCCR